MWQGYANFLLVKENKVRLTVDESPEYRAHSCSSHGNLKKLGLHTCSRHIILLLIHCSGIWYRWLCNTFQQSLRPYVYQQAQVGHHRTTSVCGNEYYLAVI